MVDHLQNRLHGHRHASPCRCSSPFAGPAGEVGRQTFDGDGNTDAVATLSTNGNTVKFKIRGTYTVNPDCTGTMTLNVSPLGVVVRADFVIDDDGFQIRIISTDAGVVKTRVYTRQVLSREER